MFNRHRRIHEAQQDGQQQVTSTDEELENEENEFCSPEDVSPPSGPKFIPNTVANMANVTSMPSSMSMPPAMSTMMARQMIAPQLLQQQI